MLPIFLENFRHLETSLLVLGGSIDEEIANTARVTPLVVVPGDEFDEVGAELDSCVGVKDGGVGVANEIGGDNLVVGVVNDALVLSLGGLLDDGLDLLVGRALLSADDEIDDGNIEGGDTESKTAVHI